MRSGSRKVSMQIRGKNVILTGASRGIGVFIARELHAAGAKVALVARHADLSDLDGYPALVEHACAALGSVDI